MPLAAYQNGDVQSDVQRWPPQSPAREIERICLAEHVSAALRRTGYLALYEIGVFVLDGAVVLDGQVTSYHQKQLAQEAVRKVFANAVIRNELKVNTEGKLG